MGLKVSDSLFSIEEHGAKSVRGIIHGHDGEGVEEEHEAGDEKIEKEAAVGEGANCDTDDENGSGNVEARERLGVEKSEKDMRRRELRNVSLAASATAILVAAI